MKQTAVEWLISELRESKDFHRVINELNQRGSVVRHILNEAKAMEKEQIINAYKADLYPCSDEDAEDYYKQTFKSE
jgi:hypothetical protein